MQRAIPGVHPGDPAARSPEDELALRFIEQHPRGKSMLEAKLLIAARISRDLGVEVRAPPEFSIHDIMRFE